MSTGTLRRHYPPVSEPQETETAPVDSVPDPQETETAPSKKGKKTDA